MSLYQKNTLIFFQGNYRQYCESKFSKLIGKPAIFNEENEEYALLRCRDFWVRRYPNEPFENEADSDVGVSDVAIDEELLEEVTKNRFLYSKFSEPYRSEVVYLIAARQRYKGFLFMVQRSIDFGSNLVPASDVMLMWLIHQVHFRLWYSSFFMVIFLPWVISRRLKSCIYF